MFNIAFNGIITVNRGDSFRFPLTINFGSSLEPNTYGLNEHDKVYFAVMEPNQPFETALIKKVFDKSHEKTDKDTGVRYLEISFKPQDTECVLPGKYYYQIKLQRFHKMLDSEGELVQPEQWDLVNYDVDTVIDKTQFFILE